MIYSFDLRWHLGHGLTLLVIARRLGRQRAMTDAQIRQMLDDMKSGSFEDLLDALERWLPATFHFTGDPRCGKESLERSPMDYFIPDAFKDLVNADCLSKELNELIAEGLLNWPGAAKTQALAVQ